MSLSIGRRWLAAVLLACSAAPRAGAAQETAPEPRWSATLFYDAQQISSSPADAYWHTVTAGVGRRTARGSVALQGLVTRRFDITDQALITDVYQDLWRGAYGNLRAAVAPGAEVLARVDVGAEVFQSVGRMEVSARARHQRFPVAEVSTFGAGTGHYVGRWYLRPRVQVAHVEESWSPSLAFTARRYFGDSTDDLLDLSVGGGEEVLEVAGSPGGLGPLDVITSGARFVGVRAQRFFRPNLGVSGGAAYSAYDEIADRWSVSVGVLTRW